MNHGLISPSADAKAAPVVDTDRDVPVSVRPVMRPPHCSPTVRPLWSVPDNDSRDETVRLANDPIEGYAAWTWPAVTVSVQEWLVHDSDGTPSHLSGRFGR